MKGILTPPRFTREESEARITRLLHILPAANPQRMEDMEQFAREAMVDLDMGRVPDLTEVRQLCEWVLGLRAYAEEQAK